MIFRLLFLQVLIQLYLHRRYGVDFRNHWFCLLKDNLHDHIEFHYPMSNSDNVSFPIKIFLFAFPYIIYF